MIRANDEWEFLYNKLKDENKILKEYQDHIFEYTHKNLGTGTLGMHIAAGLVKEHRELKAEVIKLRAENERLRKELTHARDIVCSEFCGNEHHEQCNRVSKALRGADET